MPTYETSLEFRRNHADLSEDQKLAFKRAVEKFVADLSKGKGFRKGLRVKGLRGAKGLFEMTWAPDGRAVFGYGDPVIEGEPHIVWHAVGTHAVLP